MMTNLFSAFHSSTSVYNLSLNSTSTFFGLMITPSKFCLIPSRYFILWNSILTALHKEFKTLIGYKNICKESTFIFISLFSIIMFNNFSGLFPYVFTSTSHMTMTLSSALPLWLTFLVNSDRSMMPSMQGTNPSTNTIYSAYSNNYKYNSTRNFSSSTCSEYHCTTFIIDPSLSASFMSQILITQIALLILQSPVAIIRSYVLPVLTTLYSSEVN